MLRPTLSTLVLGALAAAALLVPVTASADTTGDVTVRDGSVVFAPDGKTGTATVDYVCFNPDAVDDRVELDTALFQGDFEDDGDPGPVAAYPDVDQHVTCDGTARVLTITYGTEHRSSDADKVRNGEAHLGFYVGSGGPGDLGPLYREVTVSGIDTRATVKITTDAHPEHVKRGKDVRVEGKIKRNGKAYKKKIDLEFKPDGGSYTKIRSVTSNARGRLSTTVEASGSGSYRYTFAGTSKTRPGTSRGDHIVVSG